MNFFRKILPALMIVCLASAAQAAPKTIKFATLAPDGTTWMNSMREFSKEVENKTEGRVKFKIYAGGTQGDEKDVVRKMRLGQLQGAGLTGVGIGEIAPAVRLLDTPFFFKSPREIDHIYDVMDSDFRAIFEEKGYVLLGWAEVGIVTIFSNEPITKKEDFRKVKMWLWEGDPTAEAAFTALDIKPIPLSVTDVMSSLQTGMINAVYASPLSAMALQWNTKMKYMLTLPLTTSAGAVVISKKAFDSLDEADRAVLLEEGRKSFRALTVQSRRDNDESLKILAKSLTFVKPENMAAVKGFEQAGDAARKALTGKLYSEELLNKVQNELKAFRADHRHGHHGRPDKAAKPENKGQNIKAEKQAEHKKDQPEKTAKDNKGQDKK